MSAAREGRNRNPLTGQDKTGDNPASGLGTGRESGPLEQVDLRQKITGLTETNRQLKRKIFDLYTIFEISRNFNSVLDYHLLLDTFIFTSLAQVGASKAAIYLERHEPGGGYVLTRKKGSGKFPADDLAFEEDSRLINYLAKLNRPVATGDLKGDIATSAEKKILKQFQSGLAVPLIHQTCLSGILLVADKMSGREFRMDDIEFLSILASQISVAIENTRLYEAEKVATKQLRSAQQQLVQSERLTALGDMSAKVAHEINNPLGIIKNYLLLIRRAIDRSGQAEEYTEIVSQEIDRIARIVKELLDFHRPKGVKFEKVDLAAILEDVLILMSRQFESKGIELIKDIDPDLPLIDGSPENLKQVFLNIIINAVDVMSEGGTLAVQVHRADKELSMKFCDTGPGISPEIIPRIFEPFFTTKGHEKGTGLGLSVCYGIIKKHGGTIVFNNIDTGGCFQIRMPLKQRAGKQKNA